MISANSQRTKKFLQLVAQRLSSRSDCKKVEFIIDIGVTKSNCIIFTPDVYVYTDKYHRSDKDYSRITDFILYKYFETFIKGRDEFGNLIIDTVWFSHGIYKYQLSTNGKKRRWIRL